MEGVYFVFLIIYLWLEIPDRHIPPPVAGHHTRRIFAAFSFRASDRFPQKNYLNYLLLFENPPLRSSSQRRTRFRRVQPCIVPRHRRRSAPCLCARWAQALLRVRWWPSSSSQRGAYCIFSMPARCLQASPQAFVLVQTYSDWHYPCQGWEGHCRHVCDDFLSFTPSNEMRILWLHRECDKHLSTSVTDCMSCNFVEIALMVCLYNSSPSEPSRFKSETASPSSMCMVLKADAARIELILPAMLFPSFRVASGCTHV